MKVLSLFSGIGAFEKALKNLEIPFELVGFSEIDKYAVKSYCAIHGVSESLNFGDISKIDTDKLPADIDLITYGFPCQDISIAGKQKGLINEDGTQTRSGLFFEALRIIEDTRPKIAIAENVKNLVGKKFNAQFQVVLTSLEEAGYNNYWKVLNAKDFGIPQNRERVFIVSIRKDIDTGDFTFPEGFPLELRLKDMLEAEVDEKYYLDTSQIKKVCIKNNNALVYDKSMIGFEGQAREYNDVMPTITAREWKEPKLINEAIVKQIGNLMPSKTRANPNQGRLYDSEGLSPTLGAMQGGNRQPFIVDSKPTIQRIDVHQTVTVRKYPVDTESLCETLRHHKALLYLTNNDISKHLNVPVTKVEHWFRKDDCFAIPDAEIWKELKALLQIETDEFDESITTFEEKEGVYEKSERHYLSDGIMPTLTSATAGNEKIIVGNPKAESVAYGSIIDDTQGFDGTRYYNEYSLALRASRSGLKTVDSDLRIRKLTPKECFRLMGFTDEDFAKAEAVNSNTQLYKQAGNSIVVDVIVHIFTNIFKTERTEKEMELEIYSPSDDGFVKSIEWNHEAIKKELAEKVKHYQTLVYTDAQIRDAKADRAKLNKFVLALETKRKEIKKQCLAPYEAFEKQLKEVIAIVNEPIQLIDKQIKSYEEQQRADKLDLIKNFWESYTKPFPIELEKIFNAKWLNVSVKMTEISSEIDARLAQIETDLHTLSELPDFAFESIEVYKDTLDINKAISEGRRLAEMAKRKAEYIKETKSVETVQPEKVSTPDAARKWVGFRALLSYEEAKALKQFFDSNSIKFEAI